MHDMEYGIEARTKAYHEAVARGRALKSGKNRRRFRIGSITSRTGRVKAMIRYSSSALPVHVTALCASLEPLSPVGRFYP